ncbi:MAG TPA: acyl-CoA desaturase [Propioniciclava tarda]|nr:acyl-CoA desaturase [Propioniciclava tarda]HQA31899.1 acyl-CoA desaturase [Propioniciclava tarda]HQD61584.1 acyl-CoA desaturase [Propioniciclava tarda]
MSPTAVAAPASATHRGAAGLTAEQAADLARELDALKAEVVSTLGASDAAYIRGLIQTQRILDATGRALLMAAKRPAGFVLGTTLLGVAKILENMEIGHNVIHGQWDWMRDPDIHSATWEWDFIAPAAGWKHTHNDVHHAWTNVVGKDRDVGYFVLRVRPEQTWQPRFLFNLPINAILAPFFEWGIAFYDLEIDEYTAGRKPKAAFRRDLKAFGIKLARLAGKDYLAMPLAAQVLTRSGRQAPLAGTFLANTIRNLWAHSIIFCGHFPDGVEAFSEEAIEGESRGDWYARQILGSANISGGPLMHLLSGNLSHQIEHHVYPDLPSNRYAEVAPRVKEICARYGLRYVEGPLPRQVGQAWRTIARLSLPTRGLRARHAPAEVAPR